MKIARFQINGKTYFGEVQGEKVIRWDGDPFTQQKPTKDTYDLSKVKLLAPTEPRAMYASSTVVYPEHSKWVAKTFPQMAGRRHPDRPRSEGLQVDYRAVTAIIPTGEAIVYPRDGKRMQWEAELVIVIGKKARNVSPKDAPGYILGYTLGNDVTERVWMVADASFWRSKNSDTFKPTGPYIATDLDPNNVQITTRVNGKQVESYNTGASRVKIPDIVSMVSEHLTLYPGDLILCGAAGEPTDIRVGDVVEIESPGIGVLRSPVVAETASPALREKEGKKERSGAA